MNLTREEELKQVFIAEMHAFKKALSELGFQPVSKEEIIEILLNKQLKMPKRATPKNATQQQFKYVHKNGYVIWIHTMIMDDDCSYSEKGNPTFSINNPKGKQIFFTLFQKDTQKNPKWLLAKLLAYAHFGVRVLDEKPRGYDLVEILNGYQWENRKGEIKKFLWNSYLLKLSVENRKLIARRENSIDRRLRKTQPLVDAGVMKRRRMIRSTWKTRQTK
jgi:hypothetical protein